MKTGLLFLSLAFSTFSFAGNFYADGSLFVMQTAAYGYTFSSMHVEGDAAKTMFNEMTQPSRQFVEVKDFDGGVIVNVQVRVGANYSCRYFKEISKYACMLNNINYATGAIGTPEIKSF